MSLYSWEGKILRRNGLIAASTNCCCGDDVNCACYPLDPWVDVDGWNEDCYLYSDDPPICVCEAGLIPELDCALLNGVFRPAFLMADVSANQVTCHYKALIAQWRCSIDNMDWTENTTNWFYLDLTTTYNPSSPEPFRIGVGFIWEKEYLDWLGVLQHVEYGIGSQRTENGYCNTSNYLTTVGDAYWEYWHCVPTSENLTIVVGFD